LEAQNHDKIKDWNHHGNAVFGLERKKMPDNIDQIVTFRTPLGGVVAGHLQEVGFEETKHGVETFLIKLGLDYPAYQQIDEQEFFNLLPQARNDLLLEKLEVGVPVELEAILRPTLAKFILDQGLTETEVAQQLVTPSETYGFLLDSESWLAYTVIQQIFVPEEIRDDQTSFKVGYKTLWQASSEEAEPGSMAEVVEQFFLEQRWPYEALSEDLYRIQVRGSEAEWLCLVKLDEEREFCLVYSVLPEPVPVEKRADMAMFLVATNYDIGVGSFEMDPEDGEVRFRTSIDVEGDRLSRALFERLASMNITMMDEFIPTLLQRLV
jgi:hypothetical protein